MSWFCVDNVHVASLVAPMDGFVVSKPPPTLHVEESSVVRGFCG